MNHQNKNKNKNLSTTIMPGRFLLSKEHPQ